MEGWEADQFLCERNAYEEAFERLCDAITAHQRAVDDAALYEARDQAIERVNERTK